MTTMKNSRPEFRPTILGLILMLIAFAGCGDSGVDVAGVGESRDTQTLARSTEDEEQIDEELEALESTVLARAADVFPGNVRMASTTSEGVSANRHSYGASLSEDGRYLSFSSKASNLFDQPINNQYQVYRKDLETGELVCVSRDSSWGLPADNRSHHSRISDDGSKIVFSSRASNLSYNVNAPDGKDNVYLAKFYPTYPGGPTNEFQVKMLTPSHEYGGPYGAQKASNGNNIVREFAGNRFIAFKSQATDLHWDDQDTRWDIYRHDLEGNDWAPELTLLTMTNNYVKANNNSMNVGLLADEESGYFTTWASNMTGPIQIRPSLQMLEPWSLTHQPMDSRKFYDVDVAEQTLSRFVVTVRNSANDGYESFYYRQEYPGQQDPTTVRLAQQCRRDDTIDISDDGRFVVYEERAQRPELGDNDTRYDIFIYDADTGEHALVSKDGPSGGNAHRPVISDDGTTIAWDQGGRVYVKGNPLLGSSPPSREQLVSATQSGEGANSGWNGVRNPSISDNGRYLTFESKATNLHADATDGKSHIYLKDLFTGELSLVSRKHGDNTAAEAYGKSFVSEDGKTVVFSSPLEDIGNDFVTPNNFSTTYVRDMESNQTTFLFTKGRMLDFGVHPYMEEAFQFIFNSYGSENEHWSGTPRGVYQGEYPYFYAQPVSLIPSWMLDQYLLQDLKVSEDGQTMLAAFTDSSVSPSRTLLYRFTQGSYWGSGNSELITEFLDFQHFDMSDDGQTIAYTERLGGDWTQKMLVLRDYGAGGYYGGSDMHFPTYTQATYPHLSGDGRFLLYDDSNMGMGETTGSGGNAYVYNKDTRESLPVREERITYPGSLRLSRDGRSVIFEDYDYEIGTQLYYVKNPHPTGEPVNPYGY